MARALCFPDRCDTNGGAVFLLFMVIMNINTRSGIGDAYCQLVKQKLFTESCWPTCSFRSMLDYATDSLLGKGADSPDLDNFEIKRAFATRPDDDDIDDFFGWSEGQIGFHVRRFSSPRAQYLITNTSVWVSDVTGDSYSSVSVGNWQKWIQENEYM